MAKEHFKCEGGKRDKQTEQQELGISGGAGLLWQWSEHLREPGTSMMLDLLYF